MVELVVNGTWIKVWRHNVYISLLSHVSSLLSLLSLYIRLCVNTCAVCSVHVRIQLASQVNFLSGPTSPLSAFFLFPSVCPSVWLSVTWEWDGCTIPVFYPVYVFVQFIFLSSLSVHLYLYIYVSIRLYLFIYSTIYLFIYQSLHRKCKSFIILIRW